jgi:predicted transcriptional regulator
MKKAQKAKPARPSFSVRLDDNERAALDKAAKAEDRPAAYIVRRELLGWLKAKGFLK